MCAPQPVARWVGAKGRWPNSVCRSSHRIFHRGVLSLLAAHCSASGLLPSDSNLWYWILVFKPTRISYLLMNNSLGAFMINAINSFQNQSLGQYAAAGGLATESLGAIRTVTALNAQPDIISRYRVFLFKAMNVLQCLDNSVLELLQRNFCRWELKRGSK